MAIPGGQPPQALSDKVFVAVPCITVFGLVCSMLTTLPLGLICRSNLGPSANVSVPVQSASTV